MTPGRIDDPTTMGRRHVVAMLAALGFGMQARHPWASLPDAGPVDGLTPGPVQRVRDVRADGTLALETGDILRLTGIRLPQATDLPPSFHHTDDSRRLATLRTQALTALRAACRHHAVRPWVPTLTRDRHNRMLAQVEVVTAKSTDDPSWGRRWLQAILITDGLARVETMAGADAGAVSLLRLEAGARRKRRGLWRDPLYHPRAPAETWPWIGTFQIVRGVVVDAAKVSGRLYLNFGPDWRRDFTVMVEHPRRTDVDTAVFLDLRDQLVQVRGWLFPKNGPMIALDHAAPLERRVWLD